MSCKELVILTGVSGAGKSTAMDYMEDVGYYCVDNMPPQLIPTFLNLLSTKEEYSKVAMVADVRSSTGFQALLDGLATGAEYGFKVKIIYLDIHTGPALKRYKLTRRRHPLADRFNGDIETAIRHEKEMLSPLRSRADYIVDTSEASPGELKARLKDILLGEHHNAIQIHCTSFGFKHGIAAEADFVLDVRCLPNPYWVEALKGKTGNDKEVDEYVFSFADSQTLLQKLFDLVDFMLPLYVKEGKSQLVLAIGCTGGRHRSVAFANRLCAHLKPNWDNVAIHHRDVLK